MISINNPDLYTTKINAHDIGTHNCHAIFFIVDQKRKTKKPMDKIGTKKRSEYFEKILVFTLPSNMSYPK